MYLTIMLMRLLYCTFRITEPQTVRCIHDYIIVRVHQIKNKNVSYNNDL